MFPLGGPGTGKSLVLKKKKKKKEEGRLPGCSETPLEKEAMAKHVTQHCQGMHWIIHRTFRARNFYWQCRLQFEGFSMRQNFLFHACISRSCRDIQIQSKSLRIAPDGHWQARPFTDRFGSSKADVLYQFLLFQGGANVLLPTRCVHELYVNTAYPRGVSRVRELVPWGEGPGLSSEYWA